MKRIVRQDKQRWDDETANLAEEAVSKRNTKELYRITKILSRSRRECKQPIRSKEGAFLTIEEEQMNRWRGYFKDLLNKTHTSQDEHHEIIEQILCLLEAHNVDL
jgi:hypothetical protein